MRLFLFLAKQTLDSARRTFGDDFADDPMDSPSVNRSRRKARFLTAKIERILDAANNASQTECHARKIKEVLRLKFEAKLSHEKISAGDRHVEGRGAAQSLPSCWGRFPA